MPSTLPAGPTRCAMRRIVSPGPQPASRQRAPGASPISSRSRPVAVSHPARLTAQPLALLTRPPQGIPVRARLLLGGTHRCRLPSRCQTTGTIRSAGSPACLTVAATTSGDDAPEDRQQRVVPGNPSRGEQAYRVTAPAGCCAAEPAAEQLDATLVEARQVVLGEIGAVRDGASPVPLLRAGPRSAGPDEGPSERDCGQWMGRAHVAEDGEPAPRDLAGYPYPSPEEPYDGSSAESGMAPSRTSRVRSLRERIPSLR